MGDFRVLVVDDSTLAKQLHTDSPEAQLPPLTIPDLVHARAQELGLLFPPKPVGRLQLERLLEGLEA